MPSFLVILLTLVLINGVENRYISRLPCAIKPLRYKLQVLTHLDDPANFIFVGKVTIEFRVLQRTRNITLNAKQLNIEKQDISLQNYYSNKWKNITHKIGLVEESFEQDFLIVHLHKSLKFNETYQITIPFSGKLNYGPETTGYFISSFNDSAKNKTSWVAATHFEYIHARNAFPCFDEPDLKAKFTVILGHRKRYNAFSNMPLLRTRINTDLTNYIWSEFEETVPISTYLVAYSLNEFVKVPTKANSFNFNIFAPQHLIEQCYFAASFGPKVLSFLETLFGIRLPLTKIDLIVVPKLDEQAMENWGLLIYQRDNLFYSTTKATLGRKRNVAYTVAHELVHQWIGNLVTMKWWNDLWLKEGFATYYAKLAVEHFYPNWIFNNQLTLSVMISTFWTDASPLSHPISQSLDMDIQKQKSHITYGKSSIIISMMHTILGTTVFRNGMQEYLQMFKYGNTVPNDLLNTLTKSAYKFGNLQSLPINLENIMNTWLFKTGYPVLNITRNYETGTLKITQERFLLNPPVRNSQNECWWIPLTYTMQSSPDFSSIMPKDWLECSNDGVTRPKIIEGIHEHNDWVLFNMQLNTLYIANYDRRNWLLITETLTNGDLESIHELNRAQLISDALYLAWSGHVDYAIAIQLVTYLKRERQLLPWKMAIESLKTVSNNMLGLPEYDIYMQFMRKILTPIYEQLHGLENNFRVLYANTEPLKILIALEACRNNLASCHTAAQKYFKIWRNLEEPEFNNPIPKELRSIVYCKVMQLADKDTDSDWYFLLKHYTHSQDDFDRADIASSLGCTRQTKLLNVLLNVTLIAGEEKLIAKTDVETVIKSISESSIGVSVIEHFFNSYGKILDGSFAYPLWLKRILEHNTQPKNEAEKYEWLTRHREGFVRALYNFL